MSNIKKFYVYIIECSNGALYTGYTTDIDRRYQEHVDGSIKCKYTRSFPPKRLAAYWEVDGSKSDAMKLEHSIKKLSKQEKHSLIYEYENSVKP